MGVNIYASRHLSDETVELLNKYNKTGYTKFFYHFLDRVNEENKKIHIGKKSYGWKFLFNHNNWEYYNETRESIDAFLKSCAGIFDEYDNEITVDDFWKDYVDSSKDEFDGKDYYEWELERADSDEFGSLTKSVAQNLLNEAKRQNYYEESHCKGKVIDYEKLNYRFSSSTDFS